MTCPAAAQYKKSVWQREQTEAATLADLTGWKIDDIKQKMKLGAEPGGDDKWYQKLWK
jgi:hypothetical protein